MNNLSVWKTLAERLPAGERLVAKIAFVDLSQRLYCALDAQGYRHLLILLDEEEASLTDVQSRGVFAVTRDLVIEGRDPQKYIDIQCRDAGGYPVFDLLAYEVAVLLDRNIAPATATSRTLAKWRRFWGREPGNILNRKQQIGLFAELWFMSEWLIPISGAESVKWWRGPFGDRNDFETEKFSVEVKATTSQRGRIYHINGLDQLETPPSGRLYFYAMRLRETSLEGENLVKVVTSLKATLAEFPDVLDHLEDGLFATGYSDLHGEEYKDLQFEIAEECLFDVRDGFPRLCGKQIKVPPGVERVEYEINLDTFDDLILAKQPSEWNP